MLLRCSPERLPQFGGVDPVEPDLVLAVLGVQQRDGVAIGRLDDAALELALAGLRTGGQAKVKVKARADMLVSTEVSSACSGLSGN